MKVGTGASNHSELLKTAPAGATAYLELGIIFGEEDLPPHWRGIGLLDPKLPAPVCILNRCDDVKMQKDSIFRLLRRMTRRGKEVCCVIVERRV